MAEEKGVSSENVVEVSTPEAADARCYCCGAPALDVSTPERMVSPFCYTCIDRAQAYDEAWWQAFNDSVDAHSVDP